MNFGEDYNGNLTLKKIVNHLVAIYEWIQKWKSNDTQEL